MTDFRRIFQFAKPHFHYVVKVFICNVLYAFFSLFTVGMIVPFVSVLFGLIEPVHIRPEFSFSTQSIVDALSYYITQFNAQYGMFSALLFVSVLFLICSLLSNLFRFLGLYFLTPLNACTTRDIRNALFHKVLVLPLSFYHKHKAGDIITRFNADMGDIESLIRNAIDIVLRQLIVIVVFLVTLVIISPWLTLLSLLIFPAVAYFTGRITKSLRKKAKSGQVELSNISSMYEESISGLRVIKSFGTMEFFKARFEQKNRKYTRLTNSVIRLVELIAPLAEVLISASLMVLILVGSIMVMSKYGLPAESLILFVLVFARLVPPFQTVIKAYGYIQRGLVSTRRVFEVLESDEKIIEKPDALPLKEFQDKIDFQDVSFAYESENVLHNICLEIKKGETVALVGNSGGGKSTIINLLLRFYDITNGKLLIDGKNIQDYIISDVRTLYGVVSQDILLFNDTIFNNICFGKENIDIERVIDAAKIANAHDFIMGMPDGYQTIVGDRGMKLSGGQKQRISIARAVIGNPPVLLLDEATSALDGQSEQVVQQALLNIMQNRTSIIIAHRLSTIQNADRIIVIQNGKIVEEGSYQELSYLNFVNKF
ncbi:MAG: ABC transporter ATP-binding protein/permease [Lentimicrobiaceae bacterium]|nr:ABC transporter ATP-binding protein/permease [Lentimicrobiaceae bacterium]